MPIFPMTILFRGTPEAAIWKTADLGFSPEEVFKRLLQVVYSVYVTSQTVEMIKNCEARDPYPMILGCRTNYC